MSALSGAAAGASAGAAAGPWGMAIGAVAGGLMGSQDSGGGAGAGPTGPQTAMLFNDARFDSSGWVVATSNSSAEGKLSKTDQGMSPTLSNADGYGLSSAGPNAGASSSSPFASLGIDLSWETLILIGAIAFLILRKK